MARFAVVLAILTLATVSKPVQRQGQQPLIRSRATFVVVDVTVLDGQRRPVLGLQAADFEVKENGKAQSISTLLEVSEQLRSADSKPRLLSTNDSTSNPSRLFVIVIDDAMVPPDPQIIETSRRIARRIVEQMAPVDLGAVMFTQTSARGVEPTSDRLKLLKAIEGFKPGFGGGPFAEQASVNTLRTIAEALGVHNQRATIAFIGIGLPLDTSVLAAGTPIGSTGDPQGRAADLYRTLVETIALAHRTNASFYTFDATGAAGMFHLIMAKNPRMKVSEAFERARPYKEFLEVVAENTGGRAAVNTNAFSDAIDQMFVETGTYYLLGFESTDPRQEGRYRRLQVRVKRSDVEVRARKGYWEEKKGERR